METLLILGSCGSSREAFMAAREQCPGVKIVFVDDKTAKTHVGCCGETVPIVKDWDFGLLRAASGEEEPGAFTQFVCGMGQPHIKRLMVEKALGHGLVPAPTIVANYCTIWTEHALGRGGVILPYSYIGPGVRLGDYVLVQASKVAHDSTVGAFTSVLGSATVAGDVVIGEGVTISVGAVVREKLRIADNVVVGMQAAVVKSIDTPGVLVLGVPAREAPPSGPA